jgi:hypothetical protein
VTRLFFMLFFFIFYFFIRIFFFLKLNFVFFSCFSFYWVISFGWSYSRVFATSLGFASTSFFRPVLFTDFFFRFQPSTFRFLGIDNRNFLNLFPCVVSWILFFFLNTLTALKQCFLSARPAAKRRPPI